MLAQITSGTVKYGETRKMADFENKRADVELSFNIPDGQDIEKAIEEVTHAAKEKCFNMFGCHYAPVLLPVGSDPTPGAINPPSLPKVHNKRAPKMPAPEHLVSEAMKSPPFDPAALEEPVANPTPISAGSVEKVITDAELMDQTTKHQQMVKNAIAINKLINELGVKKPPGRLIDLPQEKRQEYLDRLKLIQPLA